MAISVYKTFSAGEVLTAADLNASLTNFTTNALANISPLTGNLAAGSNKITGLAAGTASGDALMYGQALNGTTLALTGATTGGTTASYSGAITGLTYNGLTITTSTGTITVTNAKTLSVAKTLTLDGTDGTTITFPSTSTTFAFGTYVPTLFNTTNVAASTAYTCQYMRIGSVVHVSGRVNIDATSATSATELGMSIPIASDFAAVEQLGGVAVAGSTTANNLPPIEILADATNNRAKLQYQTTTDVNNNAYAFTFTYLIV